MHRDHCATGARYLGMSKTHLQHILSAVATSFPRLVAWLQEEPFVKPRFSRTAALASAPTMGALARNSTAVRVRPRS